MLYDGAAGEAPVATPEEIAAQLGEIGEEVDPDEESLEEEMRALGAGGARVRLMRKDERTGKLTHLESVAGTDFSLDFIREQFGGGSYRAESRSTDGRYLNKVSFDIDARYRGARWADGVPVSVALGVSPDVQRLERIVERLVGAMAQPAAPPPNPLGQMKELAEIVRTLMPAPPPESNVSALKETVELAKELVGMGREMVEETGYSDQPPWERIIEQGVVPLVKMAAERGRRGVAPAPARLALPASVTPPTVVATTPTTVTSEVQPVWQLDLARYIPLILARAKKHADPETTAAFVLQELNEDTITAIAGAAEADEFVDTVFAKLPPEFRADPNVEAWTREFLAAVPRLLFEEEEPATTDAPPPGAEKPEIGEAGE